MENSWISIINCKNNLILTYSANCVILSTNNANQVATFEITDTKPYVPVLTSSTQDNARLLEQLKSGFSKKSSVEQLSITNI